MTRLTYCVFYTALSLFCSVGATKAHADAIELMEIFSANDVQIGGSLTLPKERKTEALVIMLSGSGPQDRDETLDGFKVFKELSESLGERGIATFRFDDRGVGQSTGNFVSSTLENHAHDVRSIMEHFKNHRNNRFGKFILLGHSQGGIVSARVAVGNGDVEKVILMGAPSVPLIEIVSYQIRQEYDMTDIDTELVEAEVSAHNRVMHAIHEKRNLERALSQFNSATKAILSAASSPEKSPTEIEGLAQAKTDEFKTVYALPSLTSFLYHDTAKDYEQLDMPVLGLFGGKDLQVTIAQNKDRMENALLKSKGAYQFNTFSNANHYFQKAGTGRRDEYASLDKQFVEGFVDTISGWILEN